MLQAGIHPTDPIEVFFEVEKQSELAVVIENMSSYIKDALGVGFVPVHLKPPTNVDIMADQAEVVNPSISSDNNRSEKRR